MKRLLPLLLVLLLGQNMLLAQKAVLLRTQYESYAIDNETDSLLPVNTIPFCASTAKRILCLSIKNTPQRI